MREDGQRTGFVLGSTAGNGRILLWDNFEGVFKWGWVPGWSVGRTIIRTADGYGGSYSLNLAYSRRRPNGMLWMYAGRTFGLVSEGRVSVEGVFKRVVGAACDGMGLQVWWYDGEYRNLGAVRVDFFNNRIQYYDKAGYYLNLETGVADLAVGGWHHIGFVVDREEGEYVETVIDGSRIDMAGKGYGAVADGGAERAWGMVQMGQMGVGGQTMRVDDVLVRSITEEGSV